MTDTPIDSALSQLTDIQREAVDWNDGALLVLAGPSGKTQVLTCRIAGLLDASRDKSFAEIAVSVDQVSTEAEATGQSYFATWLDTAEKEVGSAPRKKVLELITAASEDSL